MSARTRSVAMQSAGGGRHRYAVLWKPYATLCSFKADDAKAAAKGRAPRRTLVDLGLPDGMRAVGRLDRDSEGLLLLTDDGQFCHRVLQGGTCVKRYLALVAGHPCAAALASMAAGGLAVRGATTQPAESVVPLEWGAAQAVLPPAPVAAATRSEADSTWLAVTICEGRNRQVRRMTLHAGHRTVRLVRVAIGGLRAEEIGLQPGCWREIDPARVLPGWSALCTPRLAGAGGDGCCDTSIDDASARPRAPDGSSLEPLHRTIARACACACACPCPRLAVLLGRGSVARRARSGRAGCNDLSAPLCADPSICD